MADGSNQRFGAVDTEEIKKLTFETRTELDTIIGFADLLAEDLTDKPDVLPDLHHIRQSAVNIRQMVSSLENHVNKANEAATRDPLTGIWNRRAFEARCRDAFAREPDAAMSLVLIDLDKFKYVNDTYGHLVGDEVLKAIVQRCQSAVRESDVLARLAGDEFVLLLPHTPPEEAFGVADRVRVAVVKEPLATSAGALPVTVSVGVATRRPGDAAINHLIERADRAMYVSKNEGRNRITSLSE